MFFSSPQIRLSQNIREVHKHYEVSMNSFREGSKGCEVFALYNESKKLRATSRSSLQKRQQGKMTAGEEMGSDHAFASKKGKHAVGRCCCVDAASCKFSSVQRDGRIHGKCPCSLRSVAPPSSARLCFDSFGVPHRAIRSPTVRGWTRSNNISPNPISTQPQGVL